MRSYVNVSLTSKPHSSSPYIHHVQNHRIVGNKHYSIPNMKKIVVRIPNLNTEKIRAKAMKIVAKLEGVGSIAVQGESMEEMMVIGEVDAVEMTCRLRKKLGSAEVISVGEVVSEETSTTEDNSNSSSTVVEQVVPQQEWFSPPYYCSYYPQYLPCYPLY